MKVTIEKEISFFDFDAWSGAVNTLNTLMDLDGYVTYSVEQVMEDYFDEVCMTDEGEINDFLWFEDDYIASLFGFDDWEALENFVEHEGKEPIQLAFDTGDEVMYGEFEATIVDTDEYDEDCTYLIEFEENGELTAVWVREDEIELA